MAEKLIVKNEITINAPADKVWDALVNPDKTKVYMFGSEAVSDWKPGSPLIWKGVYEGSEMIFVKGVLLRIEPNQLLKYTVIDPNAEMEDVPENYLNVQYQLQEQDGKTVLTVTQDGFEDAANGEQRYIETYNNGDGWNPILIQIKSLVEENLKNEN